jgi:hypothetical protein
MFVMAAGSVGYHSAMSENVASVLAEAGDRPQCSGRYGALHISTPHASLHEATGLPLLSIVPQLIACAAVSFL